MIFDDIAIPTGASRIGAIDPDRRISLTVILCAKKPLPSIHSALPRRTRAGISTPQSHREAHLTHAKLCEDYGAVAGAAELIERFAGKHRLKKAEQAAYGRSLRLYGRAADVERAFKTNFDEFELRGHKFFAPTRPLQVPAEWKGMVETVLGLQSPRLAWPRRHSAVHGRRVAASLPDLAQAYSFPQHVDGSGETIALIEFGGGFYPEDIHQFCAQTGVATPRITTVAVGGGANRPSSRREIHEFLDVANGTLSLAAKTEQSDPFLAAQCTAEVTMDLEILAALAPGSHIVVYFASSDEQGLYHALAHAVHDDQHRPGILSVSWSVPEPMIQPSELHAIEGVLEEAAHLGITVCASSGDAGALNGSTDGRPSVNYPASSPLCLACGGTSGKIDRMNIPEEAVWNATHHGIKGSSGGGISERFQLPAWQEEAQVPAGIAGKKGRGVPDVAGLADPRYGCELLIGGRPFTSAGTSAVAPLWAALIARLNQALGRRCGHLHPHLYQLGKERTKALRPVLKGDNGLYHASKGWNACTGYGTPKGGELLAHLKKRLSK